MICEICKKNVATVHLTEIVEQHKHELHLCDECASKKGLSVKTHFTLQDLLTGLIEQRAEKIPEEILKLACPSCGLTFKEFREGGRLGCGEDYQVFKQPLIQLLERIHGSCQHAGKVPAKVDSSVSKEREVLDLKHQLDNAVAREDYELAAKIRDKIHEIDGEAGQARQSSGKSGTAVKARKERQKGKEERNESK
jgi:protein arginine kinase activator